MTSFVIHLLEGSFECQAQVHMSVDKEFRMKNTRLHSAGHLLDQAMIANGTFFSLSKIMV